MRTVSEAVPPAYMDVTKAQMSDPAFAAGLECARSERALYYYVAAAECSESTARWAGGWNVMVKHHREEALANVPVNIAVLITRELNTWTRKLVPAVAA